MTTKLPPDTIDNPAVLLECRRKGWPLTDPDAVRVAAELIGQPDRIPATPAATRDLGVVLGVREQWRSMPASTSSTATAPTPDTSGPKSCLDMSDAELRVFEKAHGITVRR